MKNAMFLVITVAAIASLTAVLSSTSAFAINNAQDDKNNPTFPGCGVGTGTCESNQAQLSDKTSYISILLATLTASCRIFN
jgi:hypothetical protein